MLLQAMFKRNKHSLKTHQINVLVIFVVIYFSPSTPSSDDILISFHVAAASAHVYCVAWKKHKHGRMTTTTVAKLI